MPAHPPAKLRKQFFGISTGGSARIPAQLKHPLANFVSITSAKRYEHVAGPQSRVQSARRFLVSAHKVRIVMLHQFQNVSG